MGWNARLTSGIIARQQDGVRFFDMDLHSIEELWLDGLEQASIRRDRCLGFIEFIQYETARAIPTGVEKTGEYIGWTNGEVEFVLGITCERHSFHPKSRVRK
jgi:hypothetical protein